MAVESLGHRQWRFWLGHFPHGTAEKQKGGRKAARGKSETVRDRHGRQATEACKPGKAAEAYDRRKENKQERRSTGTVMRRDTDRGSRGAATRLTL